MSARHLAVVDPRLFPEGRTANPLALLTSLAPLIAELNEQQGAVVNRLNKYLGGGHLTVVTTTNLQTVERYAQQKLSQTRPSPETYPTSRQETTKNRGGINRFRP